MRLVNLYYGFRRDEKVRALLRSFVDGQIFGEVQQGADSSHLWVLLHGWGRTMIDYSAFLTLAKNIDGSPWLVRFDLPGFGASPEPDRSWGSFEYAKALNSGICQVIEEMPDPSAVKVIVVGHSFGGRVALSMTSGGLPGFKLEGLVLSGVPLVRSVDLAKKPKFTFRLARFASRHGLIKEARMERIRSKYGSSDYRNARGIMRETFVKLVNEDYRELLRHVNVPVTLLWGVDDIVVPIVSAERAVQINPAKIALAAVPGDHFVAVTSPSVLLNHILDISQRTSG